MKRFLPFLLLLLPIAVFAQSLMSAKSQETRLLKGLGLNDTQIAQVLDIQDKTRTTMRQDAVQLRLLRAQMDKALLPASPNMTDVNNYITQIGQTRADLMKATIGARVQLRQIIGDDNFPVYTRFIMRGFAGNRGVGPIRTPGAGGMMRGNGGMMGGQAYGPMMDDGSQAFSGGPMMGFDGADTADQ